MRRRSERKKSTDVSSPAPASRRTNRRRKSPSSMSEDDKNAESSSELKNEKHLDEAEQSAGDRERDSSGERSDTKRSSRRSSRMRTPVKELQRTSPSKRRNRHDTTPDGKIDTIAEEENGTVDSGDEQVNPDEKKSDNSVKNEIAPGETPKVSSPHNRDNKNNEEDENNLNKEEIKMEKSSSPEKTKDGVEIDESKVDNFKKDVNDDESRSSPKSDKEETQDDKDQDEVKLHTRDNSSRSRSNSSDRKQSQNMDGNKIAADDDEPEEGEVIDKETNTRTEAKEFTLKRYSMEGRPTKEDAKENHHKSEEVNHTKDGKTNESSNTTAAADTGRPNKTTTATTIRKRRWITKKATESNREQILAISTDSLKTLIADVHPVPLSDVQLESSSEVEELASEREEGEQSPSPEPDRRRDSIEKLEKSSKLLTTKSLNDNNRQVKHQVVPGVGAVAAASIQRSPSPARNQASSVLYITNLVRPFTVLQLKGLLARTGKIVENGFWIDRIKSKCYVEYETEE